MIREEYNLSLSRRTISNYRKALGLSRGKGRKSRR